MVLTHYLGMFGPLGAQAADLAYTRPIVPQPDLLLFDAFSWMSPFHINLGWLAVGSFLVISGFLIPMSVEKAGTAQYVVRRLFRIYPVYIVGLALVMAAVFVNTAVHGTPFPYTAGDYLRNVSLVRDLFWARSIDGVNWTLEIELKFYILCGLLAWRSGLRRPWVLSSVGIACAAFSWLTADQHAYLLENNLGLFKLLYVSSFTVTFIPFALIGTCFFNYYKGYWRFATALGVGAILGTAFITGTYEGATRAFAFIQVMSYASAVGVFAAAFALRDRLPYHAPLNFVADISYPLYITHGVIGYSLISALGGLISNAYVVLTFTSGLVVAISYALHRFVELPGIAAGRRAAAACAPAARAVPAEAA